MAKSRKPAAPAEPKIEVLPLAGLTPDPANVRAHTPRNKSAVGASLKRFGAGRSIVLDRDNVVVAGNQTVESAAEAGISEVVVVDARPDQLVAVRRSDWSKTEATAYAISDNRSSDLATWDDDGLASQLDALQADGWDLPEMGWEPGEWGEPAGADPGGAGDAGSQKEPHPRSVTFNPEAWEVVERACRRIREMEGDESIEIQRCLELIAADWLAGN